MSVLNQSGEEQVECPLCMEPLEVDDLNFYPCTCGYQICRFCWHRIRTDENGLCPACRKAYSENPADFTPLSKEQVAQLKAEKRQRDQQRKAKLSESRKHLASVRVVQKNLVFVVGLPVRLADADVLKRHEYFGKFGKIHKVVINQSTSYAGSQGPSASAYVTYMKSDDALRAIQSVNNITLDGRLIKSSLGTTKYCSHFMKNQPCPKVDCMYLHDFGDPEASFTKEQMHLGKHQEYEKKLHDALLSRAAAAQLQQQQQQTTTTVVTTTTTTTNGATEKVVTSSTTGSGSSSSVTTSSPPQDAKNTTAKQKDNTTTSNWPTLSTTPDTNGYTNHKSEKQKIDTKTETKSQKKSNQKNKNNNNNSSTNNNLESLKKNEKTSINKNGEQLCPTATDKSIVKDSSVDIPAATIECIDNLQKIQLVDDNSSFFSHNTFQKLIPDQDSSSYSTDSSSVTPHSNILNDNLPDISSSEDWQAAFGFGSQLRKSNGTPPAQTNPVTSETYIRPAENGFVHHKPAAAPLETINGINHHLIDGFVKQNGYDGLKSRESSILDMLAGRHFLNQQQQQQNERLGHQQMPYLNHTKSENGLNGLDQQMTKFFAEFNNKSQQQQQHKENFFNSGLINQQTNGFVPNMPPNDRQQNFISNQLNLSESQHNNLLIYQQRLMDKQLLEDQAIYNLKQNVFNNPQQQQQFLQQQLQQQQHHSGTQQFLTNGTDHYMNNQNGQNFGNSPYTQNSVYQQNQTLIQQRNQLHLNNRSSVDDELGFDPFHETQKALAELIESEQGVSQLQTTNLLNQSSLGHNSSSSGPVNGLVHGAGVSSNAPGSHLPPPPPGFMQQQPNHMNSFGSKVLPFLNMSNSQQISSSNSSGGWTTYNNTEPHMKALPAVNDWTTLDPAIVSSSRHFPLANIQPLRNFEYNPFQQQQQQQQQQQAQQQQHQQQQNPMRNYDYSHTNGYTNNSFANNSLSQHTLQTYTNNYGSHSATTNGLNWFDNDIHGQISSPPGFRQPTPSAQSKTQEC